MSKKICSESIDWIHFISSGRYATCVYIGYHKKNKLRSIEEPVSEALVRGPRIGFTETLSNNTALLRQHGENCDLSMIPMQVGERSKKELVLAYIKEIADPNLIEEVKHRINKINIDDVPESGYIEQLIEDNFLSPFTQVQNTERPDRVMGALLEGRVAILLDGTPYALIVPVTFSMLLQSPEDYYERWLPSSLIRLLRYLAAGITLLAPSLYISFVSFHQGLIPTKLALSMMGTREGVPFPAIIEALIMEVAIEILREAGFAYLTYRTDNGNCGRAGYWRSCSSSRNSEPNYGHCGSFNSDFFFCYTSIQCRYNITIASICFDVFFAAIFGLFGVVLFFLFLCSHLVKLKSFGVPYVSPTIPYRASDWKDFMVRMPLMMMKRRPKMLHTKDPIRKD